MTDRDMREAEAACKVAAAARRRTLGEAQADLMGALAGGAGHRVPPGWDREPLMALPKRRGRKAQKAPGAMPCS